MIKLDLSKNLIRRVEEMNIVNRVETENNNLRGKMDQTEHYRYFDNMRRFDIVSWSL